jgi:hypothetical protein
VVDVVDNNGTEQAVEGGPRTPIAEISPTLIAQAIQSRAKSTSQITCLMHEARTVTDDRDARDRGRALWDAVTVGPITLSPNWLSMYQPPTLFVQS